MGMLPSTRCRSIWAVRDFFFQAEDGIRDVAVTGVQTCALPICFCIRDGRDDVAIAHLFQVLGSYHGQPVNRLTDLLDVHIDERANGDTLIAELARERSEERRVGKECRSRWLSYH